MTETAETTTQARPATAPVAPPAPVGDAPIEKAVTLEGDMAYVWAPLTKVDKDSRLVAGPISGANNVDYDGQIVDTDWLRKAVGPWFTYANIRQSHDPKKPVGKGQHVDLNTPDGVPVLMSKVVDDTAWNLVKEGVLSGYSVGIKNPRIVRDAQAPKGRIVGGDLVEVSLVDHPCNSAAKFAVCKAVGANAWQDLQTGNIVESSGALVPTAPTTGVEKVSTASAPAPGPYASGAVGADGAASATENGAIGHAAGKPAPGHRMMRTHSPALGADGNPIDTAPSVRRDEAVHQGDALTEGDLADGVTDQPNNHDPKVPTPETPAGQQPRRDERVALTPAGKGADADVEKMMPVTMTPRADAIGRDPARERPVGAHTGPDAGRDTDGPEVDITPLHVQNEGLAPRDTWLHDATALVRRMQDLLSDPTSSGFAPEGSLAHPTGARQRGLPGASAFASGSIPASEQGWQGRPSFDPSIGKGAELTADDVRALVRETVQEAAQATLGAVIQKMVAAEVNAAVATQITKMFGAEGVLEKSAAADADPAVAGAVESLSAFVATKAAEATTELEERLRTVEGLAQPSKAYRGESVAVEKTFALNPDETATGNVRATVMKAVQSLPEEEKVHLAASLFAAQYRR